MSQSLAHFNCPPRDQWSGVPLLLGPVLGQQAFKHSSTHVPSPSTLNSMMNKYALAFTALALAPVANGQNWITLTDEGGNDVTNGSVTFSAPGSNALMEVDLLAEVATGPRVVNVKRYELNVITGSQNYFCWDLCYLPRNAGQTPLWIGSDYHTLDAGVEFNGFHAYHLPNGTIGAMCYRYVWYDTANPSDSAQVDICFDNAVGIAEVATVQAFTLSPNPANDVVGVSFDPVGGSADAIVVHNALGAQVLTAPVAIAQRGVQLKTATLVSGVYFVSLQQQGRTIGTQRLVVTR